MIEIYKHTSKTSGKSYIGFTTTTTKKRFMSHLHRASKGSKTHFHNALRKYGKDDFVTTILVTASCLVSARKAEISCIEYYDTYNSGYNMTTGGEGTIGATPWNKGRPWTPQEKKVLSLSHIGLKDTQETKDRKSKASKGKPKSDNHRNNISKGLKGIKRSEETIHKMSIGSMGQNLGNTVAKGRRHMNNNIENVMATSDQINHYLYRGFKFGRMAFSKHRPL